MAPIPPLHIILSPAAWPQAPPEMTFSTLRTIEECPRRWALSNGEYPALWAKPGYPPRLGLAALSGDIQHKAVETVLKALVERKVSSLHSPEAVTVLRDLGGLSTVLRNCLERELGTWADNPRAACMSTWLHQQLEARLPTMRQRVQVLLARLPSVELAPGGIPQSAQSGGGGRLPLGIHPERWLSHPELGWKGKADLLVISPDGACIFDFKTGDPKPDHVHQLQLYGFLWTRDTRLNPSGMPPLRLLLCYDTRTVEVPPLTGDQIDLFERQLVEQTSTARQGLGEIPPLALPGVDRCPYCPVRHLCSEYWKPETQALLVREVERATSLPNDFEVNLFRRQNARQWDVRIGSSLWFAEEQWAVLRLTRAMDWLQPGMRLRVLMGSSPPPTPSDSPASEGGDQDSALVITQNAWTELYVL